MNDDVSFVAEHYPARFHQTAALPESVAGHIGVNMARVKAAGTMITVGPTLQGSHFLSAVSAGESLVASDEIFTLVHEVG